MSDLDAARRQTIQTLTNEIKRLDDPQRNKELELLREKWRRQQGTIGRLQSYIAYLNDTAIPHARKQEHANGFQAGWHSALDRLRDGDALDELRALVPDTRKEER